MQTLAQGFNANLKYVVLPTAFPPEMEGMSPWNKVFKPCSLQRLFLPVMSYNQSLCANYSQQAHYLTLKIPEYPALNRRINLSGCGFPCSRQSYGFLATFLLHGAHGLHWCFKHDGTSSLILVSVGELPTSWSSWSQHGNSFNEFDPNAEGEVCTANHESKTAL